MGWPTYPTYLERQLLAARAISPRAPSGGGMLLLADLFSSAAVQIQNGAETLIHQIAGVDIPADSDGALIHVYVTFANDSTLAPAILLGDVYIDGVPLEAALAGENFTETLPVRVAAGPTATVCFFGIYPGTGVHTISVRTAASTSVGVDGDGVQATRARISVFSVHTPAPPP